MKSNIKKIGRRILAVFLVLTLASGLVSCGNTKKSNVRRLRIGVVIYNEGDLFLKEITSELTAQAKKRSRESGEKLQITVSVLYAREKQSIQDDQVEDLIDNGCNVLAVNLVDRNDPMDIIDLARKNNVPVIFFNRELIPQDLNRWSGLYYVGARAAQSGEMQGEEFVDYLKKHPEVDRNHDGKIQHVVFRGEINHQDSIIRTDRSVNTILDKGVSLEKISYEVANWSRSQAENRMNQLLESYGSSIELVLCNNDDMALGVLDACEKRNISQTSYPVIFGVDGTKEVLQDIKKGLIQGTVNNDGKAQADKIMDIAVRAFEGKDLRGLGMTDGKSTYIDYQKVTPDNVDVFLKKK